MTDAHAVFATIFDHRPFLEGEQQFFIKEFEVRSLFIVVDYALIFLLQAKRGDKDVECFKRMKAKFVEAEAQWTPIKESSAKLALVKGLGIPTSSKSDHHHIII